MDDVITFAHKGCHGLVPWRLTLVANQNLKPTLQMPRACPVEIHVVCYKESKANSPDALCLKSTNHTWIGSVQGAVATWSNHQSPKSFANIACRSLTRSLPFPVLTRSNNDFRLLRQSPPDVTGLACGDSRWLLFSCEREPPRLKAVASRLHGASPWHLRLFVQSLM